MNLFANVMCNESNVFLDFFLKVFIEGKDVIIIKIKNIFNN